MVVGVYGGGGGGGGAMWTVTIKASASSRFFLQVLACCAVTTLEIRARYRERQRIEIISLENFDEYGVLESSWYAFSCNFLVAPDGFLQRLGRSD